uniref:Uncharacterized protein n=1 Tax=Lotharella globosa TaxID=91324 RepID=A0A7S4DGL2_9EUKA
MPNNLTAYGPCMAFAHKAKVIVKPGTNSSSVLFQEKGTVTVIKHVKLFQECLVVCTDNGHICIYGAYHKKGIYTAHKKELSSPEGVSLNTCTSDGKSLLFIGSNTGIMTFEVKSSASMKELPGISHNKSVTALAYGASKLFAGDETGALYVYNRVETAKDMQRAAKIEGKGYDIDPHKSPVGIILRLFVLGFQ